MVPPSFVLSGFPKDVTLKEIRAFLPSWASDDVVYLHQLQRHKRTFSAHLKCRQESGSKALYSKLCEFFVHSRFRDRYIVTIGPLKKPHEFARELWEFIVVEKNTVICDRDTPSDYFRELCNGKSELKNLARRKLKSIEYMAIKQMRQLKLFRTVRADNHSLLALLANPNDLQFPTSEQEDAARKKLREEHKKATSNKEGVVIPELPNRIVGTIGETKTISFEIKVDLPQLLSGVQFRGRNSSLFRHFEELPLIITTSPSMESYKFEVSVVPSKIGVIRTQVYFTFDDFLIVRSICMSCGHHKMNAVLQPTTPYQRIQRKYVTHSKHDTVGPPKQDNQVRGGGVRGGGDKNPFVNLPQYMVPTDIVDCIRAHDFDLKMDSIAWKNNPSHDSMEEYGLYWQHLLYASEHQMRRDIQLYDMENVRLQKEGRHFLFAVPGLAEGRPSVLRGDLVCITFKNCLYKGRVMFIRQLEVVLDLHSKFARNFNASVDRVNVRFTFSRTTLRTSHRACESLAETHLGAELIVPGTAHIAEIYGGVATNNRPQAVTTNSTLSPWANRFLNLEQQAAVQQIANGRLRPLPYIIFGPPGTGKTTTVVETIYQLGKRGKKILLVAPSNDAADILVERLAAYYPPSEMRRILAFSRSIDMLPASIRSYATDGMDSSDSKEEIISATIVVSTVNLAARFSFWGIPRGHFEVVCVDEAGHATEPEVVAVAASLLNLQQGSDKVGQLILAGDPKQLGPISASDICLKYGLSVSYMERLTDRGVYQPQEDGQYPKDLLTKLVRNYRSHPAILKLPNEMFYKDLKCCGDMMVTSNMVRWEHLPKPGFPVVFHAMDGENLREGNSPSWFNPVEAQQVVEYVCLLTQETKPSLQADEIGIITPYARQAQKIRLALRVQGIDDVKVGSVDSFQGQERRAIIISTVRAEREQVNNDLRYNLGFVAHPKRFNVAVTRAKALLIVIGSPAILALDKDNWLPFLKYCHQNKSWVGDDWDPTTVGDIDDAVVEAETDEEDDADAPSQAAQQEGFVFVNSEE